MPRGDHVVSVSELRDAIASAAQRSSANRVAAEVGMSTRSLLDFIRGSNPRASTRRKLTLWYIRSRPGAGDLSATTAASALELLLEHLPGGTREEARQSLLGYVAETSRNAGVEVPRWVREIRRSLDR
jgi:hypothetical protein